MNWPLPSRLPFSMKLPSGARLELGVRPIVMGVLNVTPDSFAETGSHLDPSAALDEALRLEGEGADIIDVGAESTRPGAEPVTADVERDRLLPVIRRIATRVRIPISVDTYKSEVAQAALAEGASIVNDVSGLLYDPRLAEVAARADAPIVLTHTRGRSSTMYARADYQDVVNEVVQELRSAIAMALSAGVNAERIVVDPGIGFAKRPIHSYGVLARLPEIARALGRPVLIGPSRKSFMREALGDRSAPERDWGTAAAVTACVLAGAHIVRVHAVEAMVQVVRVAEEIRRQGTTDSCRSEIAPG